VKTIIIKDNDLSYAVDAIKRGGLVAVPTETVYGLAANGLDANAVARIYEVKGRPSVKPLSLLVSGIPAAEAFCAEIPDCARQLAEAFWPGPLTMVLPRRGNVPDIVTAGGATVGIRCPDHAVTLELMRLAGVPLAAPSANPSDMPSPKTASDVLAYFDGLIDFIIDGGECALGVESTIIDLSVMPYKILRYGALAEDDIWSIIS